MKADIQIDPGICKFNTTVTATSEDRQHVDFSYDTDCASIQEISEEIKQLLPINAIMTLGPQENPIMTEFRKVLVGKGCCEACVVPAGTLKAMQVVTGLALPRDVSMKITTD